MVEDLRVVIDDLGKADRRGFPLGRWPAPMRIIQRLAPPSAGLAGMDVDENDVFPGFFLDAQREVDGVGRAARAGDGAVHGDDRAFKDGPGRVMDLPADAPRKALA